VFSRTGNDLIITVTSTGATINVDDEFLSGDYGVESFKFADGTIWTKAYVDGWL
jgi:hypothetical protein